MANLLAVHSVANSLLNVLRNAYPASFTAQGISCSFHLFASDDMSDPGEYTNLLTLYLYRLLPTEHRQQVPAPGRKSVPLSLDLHFLLTVWTDSALAEQVIMPWAMHYLHRNPLLNISSLSPEAGWQPDDVVHVTPTFVSNEDLMRIWDAIDSPYHLSVAYTARVIYIEDEPLPAGAPVVARQLGYGTWEREV